MWRPYSAFPETLAANASSSAAAATCSLGTAIATPDAMPHRRRDASATATYRCTCDGGCPSSIAPRDMAEKTELLIAFTARWWSSSAAAASNDAAVTRSTRHRCCCCWPPLFRRAAEVEDAAAAAAAFPGPRDLFAGGCDGGAGGEAPLAASTSCAGSTFPVMRLMRPSRIVTSSRTWKKHAKLSTKQVKYLFCTRPVKPVAGDGERLSRFSGAAGATAAAAPATAAAAFFDPGFGFGFGLAFASSFRARERGAGATPEAEAEAEAEPEPAAAAAELPLLLMLLTLPRPFALAVRGLPRVRQEA